MKGLVVLMLVLVAGVLGLLVLKQPSAEDVAAADSRELTITVDSVEALPGEHRRPVAPPVEPMPVEPAPLVPSPVGDAPVVVDEPSPAVVESVPVVESVLEEVRVLVGRDQTAKEVLDADLEKAVVTTGWVAYEALLERSLLAALDGLPTGSDLDPYRDVWAMDAFYTALLRWHVLQVLPPAEWRTVSEYSASAELARWLFTHPEAMEEVLLTVSPKDDVSKVMALLVRCWGSHDEEDAELAPKYFNLALACAVVFDREVKLRNSGGDHGYTVDPEQRYAWYVAKNEKGWLEVSIQRSPARDLVFVVCAPITNEDLEWAVRKFRSTRRDGWGKTFGSVKYLMERAVEGLNPYDEYSLEEILDKGGICGDQTYFCVNTARAAGIPAIGLSGVTDSGGHAWAAVKVEKDAWTTKIGRIGGVSDGKGGDPQTGERISEQEIWMWSSRDYQDEKRVLKVHRHLWLADLLRPHGHDDRVATAVGVAFRVGKAFPVVWEYQYQVMLKDEELAKDPASSATVGVWSDFSSSIKREFRENPRMGELAVKVEDGHVFPHQDLGDVRRSLLRDRRRHGRHAAEQSDLVVSTLRREARFLLEKDSLNAKREICQLYDGALKDFGSSITGFKIMAKDYFDLVGGDPELGRKVVRDIELAFQRVVDSGTTDYFRAQTEAGLHKMICEMYRKVGDEKRAKLLENRVRRQQERAKRGAL